MGVADESKDRDDRPTSERMPKEDRQQHEQDDQDGGEGEGPASSQGVRVNERAALQSFALRAARPHRVVVQPRAHLATLACFRSG